MAWTASDLGEVEVYFVPDTGRHHRRTTEEITGDITTQPELQPKASPPQDRTTWVFLQKTCRTTRLHILSLSRFFVQEAMFCAWFS